MKTAAALLIETYKSMGINEERAWQAMDRIAQKYGYNSYRDMPSMLSRNGGETTYDTTEIAGMLKDYLSKHKGMKKFELLDLINDNAGSDINKDLFYRIMRSDNSRARTRKTAQYIYMPIKQFLEKNGYKIQHENNKACVKNYIYDESIPKRLTAYMKKHKYSQTGLSRKIKETIGITVSASVIRGTTVTGRAMMSIKTRDVYLKFFEKEGI